MGSSGVGLDVVEIDRIARLIERRPAFRDYFSAAERDACARVGRPARAYAACLAAKEAFLKAVGEGVFGGIALPEIELVPGEPVLRLGPSAHGALVKLGHERALVTIGDDGLCVMAFVVLGPDC